MRESRYRSTSGGVVRVGPVQVSVFCQGGAFGRGVKGYHHRGSLEIREFCECIVQCIRFILCADASVGFTILL